MAKKRVRLFQAGDLPGRGNRINVGEMRQLVEVLKDAEGWGYTHKPVYSKTCPNAKIIKYCNDNGLTINLSADNFKEADKLLKFKIAPVVITLPVGNKELKTPKGNKIVICPAVSSGSKVTCGTCGGKKGALCYRRDRNCIVGFPAHGSNKSKITKQFGGGNG